MIESKSNKAVTFSNNKEIFETYSNRQYRRAGKRNGPPPTKSLKKEQILHKMWFKCEFDMKWLSKTDGHLAKSVLEFISQNKMKKSTTVEVIIEI
ncbi:hypothetical protein BB561_005007 [Smittium simulii]|uniref:Uncharacterized protein n=1 Tax=Smittium simulii TaxID=133385 RepID=A0A2T9YCS9_9FUNG|nr:hypothetical protein BB561_005007 [Smittium simulii]